MTYTPKYVLVCRRPSLLICKFVNCTFRVPLLISEQERLPNENVSQPFLAQQGELLTSCILTALHSVYSMQCSPTCI